MEANFTFLWGWIATIHDYDHSMLVLFSSLAQINYSHQFWRSVLSLTIIINHRLCGKYAAKDVHSSVMSELILTSFICISEFRWFRTWAALASCCFPQCFSFFFFFFFYCFGLSEGRQGGLPLLTPEECAGYSGWCVWVCVCVCWF